MWTELEMGGRWNFHDHINDDTVHVNQFSSVGGLRKAV